MKCPLKQRGDDDNMSSYAQGVADGWVSARDTCVSTVHRYQTLSVSNGQRRNSRRLVELVLAKLFSKYDAAHLSGWPCDKH